MKRFSEQLKNKAETLHLSAAEKRDLKARLVSYMEYHPLPAEMRSPTPLQVGGLTGYLRGFQAQFAELPLTRMAGAFMVLFVAVVPFVAERAVPGDVLYPIKVRFNEEVRSSFVGSPYEQVEWETTRLERRLAEARVLENEGKLTPELEAEVAASVKQHSDAAQASIATIRETDSDEAAIAEIALSSALDVQSEMLEGRSQTLVGAVDAARQVASESQQTNKPSYERILGRIELESTNATELFNTIAADASATEKRDIEQRLESIRRQVVSARNIAERDQEAGVAKLTTALTDLRKVISFMTDIEVRAHVTMDDLLPTDPTLARVDQIVEHLEEVAATEQVVITQLSKVDANTKAAIEARLAEVRTHKTTASSSLAADNLDAAESAATSALTILADIQKVLAEYLKTAPNASSTPAVASSTQNR